MKLWDIFFSEVQVGFRPEWTSTWYGRAWRQIRWNFFRNFLPGLSKTMGMGDAKYNVYAYLYPPRFPWEFPRYFPYEERGACPTWNPSGGYLRARLVTERKTRTWRSYRGRLIEIAFGPKPSTGNFEFNFRHAKAKNEAGKIPQ
jgi:hypothetical protein